jgi:hypothetical protein
VKNQNTPELVGYCPELPDQIFRPILAIHKEIKDFGHRTRLLGADISFCSDCLKKRPQMEFWRRTLVRNVFVFLEAACYGLKRIALHRNEVWEVEFSQAELALLKEEKYSLDEKGEAHTHDKNFQRFIPNLKFAFRCFAKAHGLTIDLDLSKVALKDFEGIRNRITHPKQLSDLAISDAEITVTTKVNKWFLDTVCVLMQAPKRQSLPVRMPRVGPSTRLNVTKDFVVMQPDGNVYQFDSLEGAEKYRDSKIVQDLPFMTPLVFRTEDLRPK